MKSETKRVKKRIFAERKVDVLTTPIFPSRLLMKGHWREKEKPGVRNQLKALSGINWISICMERALGGGTIGFWVVALNERRKFFKRRGKCFNFVEITFFAGLPPVSI